VDLSTILLFAAAASIGATVIAALVAFRSAREARTAIFPILKEEEATRARRARVSILVWTAISALLLGGWLASQNLTAEGNIPAIDTASGQAVETEAVEFVTQPPAQEMPPTTAATPVLSPEMPTPTATVAPSPTPMPALTNPTTTPTLTPVPPPPTATRQPAGPAPAGASLGPIEFATEVAKPIKAVNPGTVFPPNVKIYAVYPYNGMQNGTVVAAVWYQNETQLARDEWRWEWGAVGNSYSFFLPPSPGQYKLELYVNDSVLATGTFEVR
jgi:hypothetical protein